MPEYLAPGVYVEEVDTGNKPIEGVSTSTAGFVGFTVRGPSDTKPPRLITSFAEYKRVFGGYIDFDGFADHRYLPHAVEGFFTNGGKRLYVKRVKGKAALAASLATQGGLVTRLSEDTSPTALDKAKLETLRGVEVGTKLTLSQTKKGVTLTSGPHAVTAYNGTTGEVTLGTPLDFPVATPSDEKYFEARYTTVTTDLARTASFKITAADEGTWANADSPDGGLDVRIRHSSAGRAEVVGLEGASPSLKIRLKSTAGFYKGAWVEIDRAGKKLFVKVDAVDGQVLTLTAPVATADLAPIAPATVAVARAAEFDLTASSGGVTESYSGLTLLNVPGRYYVDALKESQLLKVDALGGAGTPSLFPSPDDGLRFRLTAGTNGTAPEFASYKGEDNGPGNRTGLASMVDIDEVSIVAVPGIVSVLVQDAMIAHCELLKDRFAILDPDPAKSQTLEQIKDQRQTFDTKYAAIYYPCLTIYDPPSGQNIRCSPSGHIAGLYARVDVERGVHKAPANEVVRGIVGLDQIVNQGEQEILNPRPLNINVIRDFRTSGGGYRVWGARCITSDPDWKYVPVRRLFIFLEESIDQGTQWVVFEPNDEPLWARVRASVSAFLKSVRRDGALQGATDAEAFFVRCDRTTMSQADIDNGRLIMEIGVAPVKPAEFVIFRIGQWTGGASVDEG